MKIPYTKMHGAGNTFVVLDETQGQLGLHTQAYRQLADKEQGLGVDQILTVRPGREGADFEYLIHNADGSEVEQCGNGARCFARYVLDKGLTDKKSISVLTRAGLIEPHVLDDGSVLVKMGEPRFRLEQIPFDGSNLPHIFIGGPFGPFALWGLDGLEGSEEDQSATIGLVSMGNPHAVQIMRDLDDAPVATQGPQIERHPRFPNRVNAGYMQIIDQRHIRLRVYERGAGETLACGTGACAAVVMGICLDKLAVGKPIAVETRGGRLFVGWGGPGQPVMMSGPAVMGSSGEFELP